MPVILRTEDYERWLAPVDPARPPTDLLRPSLVPLEARKLDPKVGNVRNIGPELCEAWQMNPRAPPSLPNSDLRLALGAFCYSERAKVGRG
jgi:hypothetical protein